MAINYHEKYRKEIEDPFYEESLTQGSFSKELDTEFTGVRTVKVMTVDTVELVDYDRTGTKEGYNGDRYGPATELQDQIHEFIMEQDKAFNFTIDKGNNMEQQWAKQAGARVKAQMREKVAPAVDRYRFQKWYDNAGKAASATLTKDNIYGELVKVKIYMDGKHVPRRNRTLYIGGEALGALLECPQFLNLEKTGNKAVSNGEIGKVLGMRVVEIPEDYFPANVQAMVILKDAAISPMKLQETKIHIDPPGISGHKCEGRIIYDAFVRPTKKDGIYAIKKA